MKEKKDKIKEINWQSKENKQLIKAILALSSENEAQRFLRDLLTLPEIKEFAGRLEAARLLAEDTQYNTVSEKTGLSSTTIARVQKWLKGPLGGYRLILNKLHHSNSFKLEKGLS